MADYTPSCTQDAWDNHFSAFGGKDLDKIMLDYTDESKVDVFNVADDSRVQFKGVDAIRGMFASLFDNLFDLSTLEAPLVEVTPNHVFLVWRCPGVGYIDCTDTFIFNDNHKIKIQNIVTNFVAPPKLTYFEGPGRAEITRLAFAVGGVAFKDVRLTFPQFGALKGDPSSIVAHRFGSLPLLEHKGLLLAQSQAICKYAGELALGTASLTAQQRAMDDMFLGAHADMQSAMYKCLFGDDASKAAGKEALPAAVVKNMGALERALPASGWLNGGEHPTIGDCAVFNLVTSKFPGLTALQQDLSPYPKVNALVSRMSGLPGVQKLGYQDLRTFRIFQLGTNNWQSAEEFAPGSGILHAAHHETYNAMPNTKCWSIFPSKVQKSSREDVRVFELEHDIPICESVSPVSNYRWHGMSEAEFQAYKDRLEKEVFEYMAEIEEKEGAPFDLVIAHHTFLNPLAMRNVLTRRGKNEPLVVFVHGTALKMYVHEKKGANPEEYPMRFFPMISQERVFDSVSGIFAISKAQVDAFGAVFGEDQVSKDRVVVSPNGINTTLFSPNDDYKKAEVLGQLKTVPAPGSSKDSVPVPTHYDKIVVFVGKYADWKRLDAVLIAAKSYEAKFEAENLSVCTLIVGTGPEDMAKLYEKLLDDLGLKHTYIIGPHQHAMLAQLFNISSVGVFPSKNEPMGLVFIECMACGTPVIGADSGGPKDFVDDEVGVLVAECETTDSYFDDAFCERVSDAIVDAIKNDWKKERGAACVKRAHDRYGIKKQCTELLEAAKKFPPPPCMQ